MIDLDPAYAIACDNDNMDCGAWYLTKTLEFLENKGLPTRECVAGVETCAETCANGEEKKDHSNLHTAIYLATLEDSMDIQIDLLKGGPILAIIPVHTDLFAYSSGVYTHVAGDLLGYQTVKIVGWGVEEGAKYWIAENTWGSNWGINGAVHIAREDSGISGGAFTFDPFDPSTLERSAEYEEWVKSMGGDL